MCVCACVCNITWGWYSEPTTSSSMYEPSTNKDQKNTKAWVQCMPLFFQGCQPLLFKDLTLALQSNKNLLVNWLGSPNFSGFFFVATQCEKFNIPLARTGKFTNMSLRLPSVTRGLLLEQVQRGAVDLFCWGLCCWGKEDQNISSVHCDSSSCMFYLGSLTFGNLLQWHI